MTPAAACFFSCTRICCTPDLTPSSSTPHPLIPHSPPPPPPLPLAPPQPPLTSRLPLLPIDTPLTRYVPGHLSLTAMMWMEGNTLVSGNADNTLRVWNISTGHCMHVLRGHRSSVTSLAVLPGLIISSSDDGTTKLWDMHTGQFIRDLYDAAREPGAGSSGVVWSVVATETQLICAVGGDANAAGNKLVLLDFLSSAMTT